MVPFSVWRFPTMERSWPLGISMALLGSGIFTIANDISPWGQVTMIFHDHCTALGWMDSATLAVYCCTPACGMAVRG